MLRHHLVARLLVVAALSLAAAATHADFQGAVMAVLDGDTVDVLVDRRPVRVRLAHIDAPEKRQAFGTRSRQALADLVFRQVATVVDGGRDRYGRVIGTIYVGGVNVNAEMVRLGLAWVYRQYATDAKLYALEREARAARRGLWSDPTPIAPWQFRRQGRHTAGSPQHGRLLTRSLVWCIQRDPDIGMQPAGRFKNRFPMPEGHHA